MALNKYMYLKDLIWKSIVCFFKVFFYATISMTSLSFIKNKYAPLLFVSMIIILIINEISEVTKK
jgi:hypothetical protein